MGVRVFGSSGEEVGGVGGMAWEEWVEGEEECVGEEWVEEEEEEWVAAPVSKV